MLLPTQVKCLKSCVQWFGISWIPRDVNCCRFTRTKHVFFCPLSHIWVWRYNVSLRWMLYPGLTSLAGTLSYTWLLCRLTSLPTFVKDTIRRNCKPNCLICTWSAPITPASSHHLPTVCQSVSVDGLASLSWHISAVLPGTPFQGTLGVWVMPWNTWQYS